MSAISTTPRLGVALGGLGGFNAHNVGVLQAMKDADVKPDIITCTSGAIYWTWRYLAGADLRAEIMAQIMDENQYHRPFQWLNTLQIAAMGAPGIFRPAVQEYWERWFKPFQEFSLRELAGRLFPAQVYVPLRPREWFDDIAMTFNKSDVPIIFNSYHIRKDIELLHVNEAACAFLGIDPDLRDDPTTKWEYITLDAVESSLWLYLYGFQRQHEEQLLIDGAYRRQQIVRELKGCDLIYAVKPQNDEWIGHPPQNYFEVRDFLTELQFNVSSATEPAFIELINKLLAKGYLPADKYKRITVREIEVQHQLGFFNYFVENEAVYKRAYDLALGLFETDGLRAASSRSRESKPADVNFAKVPHPVAKARGRRVGSRTQGPRGH